MPRRIVRPFGASIPASRAFSLLLMLGVIAIVYDTVRQPAMWHWIAAKDNAVQVDAAPVAEQNPAPETVTPGPNDLDPDAMAEFRRHEELITDRSELRPREMIPYWQLMAWSRTQPMAEFEKRAMAEPAFTQLWEEPQKYRGQPIRLRMHVRRVLKFDAPNNTIGAKTVYEAWGWTDESKSFPYSVVFEEKPAGLPVGPDVTGEIVFVGYLLKIMSYTAFDARRGAPLLVGKVRMAKPRAPAAARSLPLWPLWVLGGAVVCAVAMWYIVQPQRPRPASGLPDELGHFAVPSAALAGPGEVQADFISESVAPATDGTAHVVERPVSAEIPRDFTGGDARR